MTAPCSWCGRPTRDEDRRYVDRYVTWWICVDCYRTTRRHPPRRRSSEERGGMENMENTEEA